MVRIFKDKSELANSFCEELLKLNLKNDMLYLALSGGSTPKIIFQTLAEKYQTKIDWNKIQLFWGDERCARPQSDESNFGMTKKYLLDFIDIPQKNIHPVDGNNVPEKEAVRYSDEIKNIVPLKNGFPNFDMVILGIGEDGHIASIFPNQMNLLNLEKICEVALHPESGQKRITLTGKVINNAERVIFLITGDRKANIVKELFKEDESKMKKYPAANIKPANGELNFFLDENAAKLLTGK
jgi:6-phosphogluconolactonase